MLEEVNVNHILNQPISLIFTPFPEELTQVLAENTNSANLYDCSNPSLVKTLNQLKEEEWLFLFAQVKWSIFSHVERLSSFSKILDFFYLNQDKIHLIGIGQSKAQMEKFGKLYATKVQGFYADNFPEFLRNYGVFQSGEYLSKWMVYGMTMNEKQKFNRTKAGWFVKSKTNRINKPENMEKTLVFLANRVHKTLGYNEIGSWCGMDNETAQRYVEKLNDYGITVPLVSFSSRKRYEYVKGIRVGFLDNGILNTYKNNFDGIEIRADVEDLWKNWVISEKIKKDVREHKNCRYFFWQSHTRQNMDLLVISDTGEKQAFMVVWKTKRVVTPPPLFVKYYPEIPVQIISPSNYLSFLS
jgi:hypothetical protein